MIDCCKFKNFYCVYFYHIINLQISSLDELACSSIDCNGGTCISEGCIFICLCPDGFTGTNCETEIDPCDSNPCENDGTCIKLSFMLYNCTCAPGYTGNYFSINNCIDLGYA